MTKKKTLLPEYDCQPDFDKLYPDVVKLLKKHFPKRGEWDITEVADDVTAQIFRQLWRSKS